jgi:hypothetical protein
MKEKDVIDLIASTTIIVATFNRLKRTLVNYSVVPLVLLDGITEGLIVSSSKLQQYILDDSIIVSVEKKVRSRVIKYDKDLFAEVEDKYQRVYDYYESKLLKTETLLRERGVEQTLLLLPHLHDEVYMRAAKKVATAKGSEFAEKVDSVLNDLFLKNEAMQASMLTGVRRAGQAIGAELARVIDLLPINPLMHTVTKVMVENAYYFYAIYSYIGKEVIQKVVNLATVPPYILTIALSGLVEGLMRDATQEVKKAVDSKVNTVSSSVVNQTLSQWLVDFNIAYSVLLKKRNKYDKELARGEISEVIEISPKRAKNPMHTRARSLLLNSKHHAHSREGLVLVNVGDRIISSVKAAEAVCSKLLYSGFKYVGEAVKSTFFSPDSTPMPPKHRADHHKKHNHLKR